jgi:glycosyltransferase involved in cell wall biosynthesis
MAGEPLVSIMIPCFNAERTLGMALASLRAQTYERWEAVVVDDGSTDETSRILSRFTDPRLRIERFSANCGRGAARQRWLEMAQGGLLAFLDADDWLFPDKLSHQVAAVGGTRRSRRSAPPASSPTPTGTRSARLGPEDTRSTFADSAG